MMGKRWEGTWGSEDRVQKPGGCRGLQADAPLGNFGGMGLGVVVEHVEASGIFLTPPAPQKALGLGVGMDRGTQGCLANLRGVKCVHLCPPTRRLKAVQKGRRWGRGW